MTASRHYHTPVSEFWLDEEGIMRVIFKKGIELKLHDMEEAYSRFREMGFGPGQNRSRQLLMGGPFTISREARQFAGSNGHEYFHAAAMVTDSVFMRFVLNVFNAVQKHDVPFKAFATEAEALEWLRKFPKD